MAELTYTLDLVSFLILSSIRKKIRRWRRFAPRPSWPRPKDDPACDLRLSLILTFLLQISHWSDNTTLAKKNYFQNGVRSPYWICWNVVILHQWTIFCVP